MAHAQNKVAVVIPFYKHSLTTYEEIALDQCSKILNGHTIIAIKPHHLTLPSQAGQLNYAAVESFDDSYFTGIPGYNRLMLSEEFYGRFLKYEFILIYQLDAFVFKDELLHWCDQGYDYIGAPWLRYIGHVDAFKAIKSNIKYYLHTRFNIMDNGLPSLMQFENKVGNGGFSLRRVKKFHDICRSHQKAIQHYLNNEGKHQYNEDAFWSIEVNRKKRVLKIPHFKVGVQFAIENSVPRALDITKGRLPFGCHAWDRHVEIWRPIFAQLGYQL